MSSDKLASMREGGLILGMVREALYHFTQIGVTPKEVEAEAQRLIKEAGAQVSFDKVPGYHWATCITINDGVVHGIPISETKFIDGDKVMVDVGVYFKGYHTDSAFTKIVGKSNPSKDRFLKAGMEALMNSIKVVRSGAYIGEISEAMQHTLDGYGYKATRELTGHGVGKNLHEEPMIPNVIVSVTNKTPKMYSGQTLAIEIIYVEGKPDLVLEDDGWTISTKDGKLSAVFEETVEVTGDGFSILTKPTLSQMLSSGTIHKT
ncbi:MAG: type I methionyl aminopeptidase [bacterium]